MFDSKKTITCLSEDIFLFIIKKLENEINNYNIKPVIRIHSFLALKNLHNSNKNKAYLFTQINMNLILSGCELSNVELINKDLQGIRFSHASMNGIILRNCNLTNVNLEYADLKGADLSGANLKNANLIGANLTGATVDKTNFSNTNINDTIFENVNLLKITFDSSL
jgi:uncharacterized protein YjbI with pentapeptide repeats